MLLRFEVSNHRSIFEPIELSMIAVDEDRQSTRGFTRLDEEVLTVAGVYGPNASGKSNLLESLAWLSMAVRSSLRSWEDYIPREPFKFKKGPVTPTTFEVEFMVDEVRTRYRLEVDDESVLFEGLYSYPEKRQRRIFERTGMDISFRRGISGTAGIRELLTPTTLALSAARRGKDEVISAASRTISELQPLGIHRRVGPRRVGGGVFYGGIPRSFQRVFEDDSQQSFFDKEGALAPIGRSTALEMLRFADLGITDVEFIEYSTQEDGPVRRDLRLLHTAENEIDSIGMPETQSFDMSDESAGTVTWLRLIEPTLTALRRGQILLFDEIDASLHPTLSARLLDLFMAPETNVNGAQMIFTSHDTSLLGHLNRDEVWLTEKGRGGSTELTALAEYQGERVRKSVNLERSYLQGRFGAIPVLDQAVVQQALGVSPQES